MPPQRIMIFGRPGSGKSTFSSRLSQKLNLPLYHLDRYFYLPNWEERPSHEFLALQQELVNQNQWIIDGNNTASLEMRYARADLVIYFSLSRSRCLWRTAKRFLRNRELNDRPAGCDERINWKFIKYLLTFDRRVAAQVAHLPERYPHVRFIRVHSMAAVRALQKELLEA